MYIFGDDANLSQRHSKVGRYMHARVLKYGNRRNTCATGMNNAREITNCWLIETVFFFFFKFCWIGIWMHWCHQLCYHACMHWGCCCPNSHPIWCFPFMIEKQIIKILWPAIPSIPVMILIIISMLICEWTMLAGIYRQPAYIAFMKNNGPGSE